MKVLASTLAVTAIGMFGVIGLYHASAAVSYSPQDTRSIETEEDERGGDRERRSKRKRDSLGETRSANGYAVQKRRDGAIRDIDVEYDQAQQLNRERIRFPSPASPVSPRRPIALQPSQTMRNDLGLDSGPAEYAPFSWPRTPTIVRFNPKTNGIIEKIKSAKNESDEEEAVEELRDQLESSFDDRMKERETQIKALEERVKKLRDQLDERNDKRDEIIDLRLKTMVNEAKGLGF